MLNNGDGFSPIAGDRSRSVTECNSGSPVIPLSFTPVSDAQDNIAHLAFSNDLVDLITDLAKQIGDSISANLSTVLQPGNSSQSSTSIAQGSSGGIDATQLKVIVQPGSDPTPFFRANGSNKISILEWSENG